MYWVYRRTFQLLVIQYLPIINGLFGLVKYRFILIIISFLWNVNYRSVIHFLVISYITGGPACFQKIFFLEKYCLNYQSFYRDQVNRIFMISTIIIFRILDLRMSLSGNVFMMVLVVVSRLTTSFWQLWYETFLERLINHISKEKRRAPQIFRLLLSYTFMILII